MVQIPAALSLGPVMFVFELDVRSPSPFGSSHTIARNFISICVFLIVNNERLVLVTSQHRPLRHPLISLPAHPPLPPDPFLVLIVSTGFPSGILINSCNVARGDNEINDNRSVIKCKYPSNVWHSPFISLLWRSTSNKTTHRAPSHHVGGILCNSLGVVHLKITLRLFS